MKHLCRVAVALIALCSSMFVCTGVASASGYPPPPPPETCSISVSLNLAHPSVLVTVNCVFKVGTLITITLNGAAYATVAAPPSGIFTEVIALGVLGISLNGGPFVVTGLKLIDTFVATGLAPNGALATATTLVVVPLALLSSHTRPGGPAALGERASAASPATGNGLSGADVGLIGVGTLAASGLGLIIVTRSRRRRARSSA